MRFNKKKSLLIVSVEIFFYIKGYFQINLLF